MHEYSLADSLVKTVLQTASENNARRVTEVHVNLGPFALVEKEQLEFCFNLIVEDTIAEGAKLVLTDTTGTIECTSCGYNGEAKPVEGAQFGVDIIACPKCGSVATRLIDGDEVFIDTIQIEQ